MCCGSGEQTLHSPPHLSYLGFNATQLNIYSSNTGACSFGREICLQVATACTTIRPPLLIQRSKWEPKDNTSEAIFLPPEEIDAIPVASGSCLATISCPERDWCHCRNRDVPGGGIVGGDDQSIVQFRVDPFPDASQSYVELLCGGHIVLFLRTRSWWPFQTCKPYYFLLEYISGGLVYIYATIYCQYWLIQLAQPKCNAYGQKISNEDVLWWSVPLLLSWHHSQGR